MCIIYPSTENKDDMMTMLEMQKRAALYTALIIGGIVALAMLPETISTIIVVLLCLAFFTYATYKILLTFIEINELDKKMERDAAEYAEKFNLKK